jgi:uncharacterized OB-fold protein
MALDLLKPDLFGCDASGRVWLKGGRCSFCGFTFFPMQTRGCERCGAHGPALLEADLGGTGRLVSAATVHVHTDKSRVAPFVVGVIDLEAGPRVRTLLEGISEAERLSGARVAALLIAAPGRDGVDAFDLRFGRA